MTDKIGRARLQELAINLGYGDTGALKETVGPVEYGQMVEFFLISATFERAELNTEVDVNPLVEGLVGWCNALGELDAKAAWEIKQELPHRLYNAWADAFALSQLISAPAPAERHPSLLTEAQVEEIVGHPDGPLAAAASD